MLANFHTHTVFCDGKNTPEEIVISAIEKGFRTIGFSGHGYTPFDLRYCMKDTDGYVAEISRLKMAYGKDIEILLGVEEDAFSPVDRDRFDYIIGSSHYVRVEEEYLPVDSGVDYFKKCLDAFGGDAIRFAEAYYGAFCDYIKARRPDIIGHFDLVTKYDELGEPLFLKNGEYNRIAKLYIGEAATCGSVFEVNTGAIARGLRTKPYPMDNLLGILKKNDAKLILSSDSHSKDTLDFAFDDTLGYLYEIGFRHLYTLTGEGLVKYSIK